MPASPAASSRARPPAALARLAPLAWAVFAIALFLIAHNFCLSLLPRVAVPLDPADMIRESGTRASSIAFDHSPGDTLFNPRSRVLLTEDGRPLRVKFRIPPLVRAEGDGSWSHIPGRIVFSTPDGSDPRTNGRHYVAHSPPLYSSTVGYGACIALLLAVLVIRRARHSIPEPATESAAPPPGALRGSFSPVLRVHFTLSALVFIGGLYCATGTLAPYAATTLPHPDPATGYLYNIDHSVHRSIVDFVDGAPRAKWEDSILLRRIVYPVLAWPSMKAFGYETGGVLFNFFLNLAGFVAGVLLVRRHIGERGAILAAWLLALYPGAAYWVGQPYLYALIFPLSLAAFWLLLELPAASTRRLVWSSLGLGVIYLGYDFHAYFLPASLLLLLWHRRWRAAVGSAALQVLPLLAWLWALKHVVQVPLENSNTTVYRELLNAVFNPAALGATLQRLATLPEVAADTFFGANFLFLPLLALAAWAMDFRWSDFIRHRAAVVLLATGAALFAFCNIPPPHPGPWNLAGSWISRVYQPILPALVFLLAWWWQHLAPRRGPAGWTRLTLVAVTIAGNVLICFGPIAGAPAPCAETAFYRFYDHTDMHWLYENNLRRFGRRPLGFPQPLPPAVK